MGSPPLIQVGRSYRTQRTSQRSRAGALPMGGVWRLRAGCCGGPWGLGRLRPGGGVWRQRAGCRGGPLAGCACGREGARSTGGCVASLCRLLWRPSVVGCACGREGARSTGATVRGDVRAVVLPLRLLGPPPGLRRVRTLDVLGGRHACAGGVTGCADVVSLAFGSYPGAWDGGTLAPVV